jgi:hypothetical protein
MNGQVAEVCRTVLDNPLLVPPRAAEAAARLIHSFGDRDFGRIRHRDFDRYLEAATAGPRSDTWKFGGSSEQACYDIHIPATLALWKGQNAFFAAVQDWLRPHMHKIGARPS